MGERLPAYARRDVRAMYPTVRDDHLRMLERWGLIRRSGRRDAEATYAFSELRTIREVAGALESGTSFRSVLRAIVAERQGQLSFDFQPPVSDATPARVVGFARDRRSAVPEHGRLPVAQGPDEGEAERHFQEGMRLEQAGGVALEAAQAAYRRALAVDPWCVAALVNLANLHYISDVLPEAHALYALALQVAPDCFEARFNLGHVLHDLERYGEATDAYRSALELRPDCADAHFYLAVTLEKLGRSRDAKPYWRRYGELSPEGEWCALAREFADDPDGPSQ